MANQVEFDFKDNIFPYYDIIDLDYGTSGLSANLVQISKKIMILDDCMGKIEEYKQVMDAIKVNNRHKHLINSLCLPFVG
jgi:hypothetical protein